MSYDIKLIQADKFTPTYWSGGLAKELVTYPETSSFAKRDFLWRLGFAKIDIPESTFSKLPGISRILMLTNGKMTLKHEGKYSKCLGPFEQDSFDGDWTTTTVGKSSVFNLMTRENYSGEVIHFNINPNGTKTFAYCTSYEKEISAICFYPTSGTLNTKVGHKMLTVKTNELLVLNPIDFASNHKFNFKNTSKEVLNVIISIIYKI